MAPHTSSFTVRETLLDEFLQFYLFFGPAGYTATETLKPLIQRALSGSSEYRVGVGEGLKERRIRGIAALHRGLLEPSAQRPFVGATTSNGAGRRASFCCIGCCSSCSPKTAGSFRTA